MSLQNLKKENNYELYCDILNLNEMTVTDVIEANTIKVYDLKPIDTTPNITIFGNLIPPTDQSEAYEIGKANLCFSNLWCTRLQGNGGAVMVQNGIIGNDATDPLYVADNGLMFTNIAPVAPVTSYTLERYVEYSGQLTAQGAIPATPVNYKAIIVGSTVTLQLQCFSVDANSSGANTLPITIVGLPSLLKPTNQVLFFVSVNVNNTQNRGAALIIDPSNGNLNMYSDTRATSYFINGSPAGFYVPTPETDYWITLSYNIN